MTVDPLHEYPGYALRRASAAAMQRLANRLGALDLRPSEASVLMVIDANPDINQSEIGRVLDIARANMAPLVGRLHERGLIARQPVDGRSSGLTLSAPGRSLCTEVKRAMNAHEAELLEQIPVGQRRAFVACLRRLWDAAKAEGAS